MIMGYSELYNLLDIDFTLGEDQYGQCVKYSERDSKNYKASMTKYQEEHFQDTVICYEKDVETYAQLMRHMLVKTDAEIGRHIFL